MLRIKDLEIKYEEILLKKTDLNIPEHCITLIRGVNGSGKTSLLYRLGLISEDTSFVYEVDHKDLNTMKQSDIDEYRRRHISFVMQDSSLFDQYDVLGNLKMYAAFNQKEYTEEEYREFLKDVHLEIPFHQSIDTLSGGERQRLAIACALCKDTEIILLDEPTSSLDELNERNVLDVLRKISDFYRKTILFTSHSEMAISIADEIYDIKDTKIFETKHAEEVLQEKEYSGDSKKLSLQFFLKYVRYYFRKYWKFEMAIICALTAALTVMNVLMVYTKSTAQESIRSFQDLSENEIFVTADAEYTSASDNLMPFELMKIQNTSVYPYVPTFAVFEGMSFSVLPYYPENNMDNAIVMTYGKEGLYISSGVMKEIENVQQNPKNAVFQIVMENNNGEMITASEIVGTGAVLKNTYSSSYLDAESKNFIYCDYEILYSLYQEYGLDIQQQYKGYTVFTDNFGSVLISV